MNDPQAFPVSLEEAERARKIVNEYLNPTPLLYYRGLSELIEADVYVKHENHQPTGSFKIRGGVNLMSHLAAAGVKGVVTFSTGNHGSSVAQAAAWFGLRAVVVVPENNNPNKNRNIRQAGAELIEAGRTFEEAAQVVERLCEEEGLYYVHPANEPHLINGVGTEFLEIAEELPNVEAVIVPIGAGSEAAAASITLKRQMPHVALYAVQAEASPAAYLSWHQGEIQQAPNHTFAGGFATGMGYEMPFALYKDQLADFVVLSEEEIYTGIALAAYYTRNMLEGAGAASIMAALQLKDALRGKQVVLQFSGCNASAEELQTAYSLPAFTSGL